MHLILPHVVVDPLRGHTRHTIARTCHFRRHIYEAHDVPNDTSQLTPFFDT